MVALATGLVLGVALGLIVMGFLAVAAYRQGYEDGQGRRKHWRAELVARRAAVHDLPAVAARKAS